jgi:hypothetical protein
MAEKNEFIDEEIEVDRTPPGPPCAFIWRGEKYHISEVISFERRVDYRSPWWLRRHRDYYRIRITDGRMFELYYHRGPGRTYWVLYRKLGG